MTTTPDATPQKEGLWASTYRLVTAPFSVRTPKNVTTRNKRRKLVHIDEIANNLPSRAEKLIPATVEPSTASDSMQLPVQHEMILFNAKCNGYIR